MKDMINERLKQLAVAQECMIDVVDVMEKWESSQVVLEKSTFDSINISDKALNLSKDGNRLIFQLILHCRKISENPSKSDIEALAGLLEEIGGMFRNILDATKTANDTAHNLELEVAYQREIAENIKTSVGTISNSVNQAVACAEFLLTE